MQVTKETTVYYCVLIMDEKIVITLVIRNLSCSFV